MAQEIDVHKQSGESPPPDPIDPYQRDFWSRLKARYGLTERSISRLTNLGKAESIRRFLWTQHQRQSRMLRLILRAKPSLDGRKRIVKVVADQMPAFLDPYKQQKTVMTKEEAESTTPQLRSESPSLRDESACPWGECVLSRSPLSCVHAHTHTHTHTLPELFNPFRIC